MQASVDGFAMFVAVAAEPRSAIASAPAVVEMPVVVDGVLHRRNELLALLGPDASNLARRDDAALVRELFLHFGTGAFSRLHGRYAVALYDPSSRTTHLASDVIGSRALAYCVEGERTCFASEQKAVLALAGRRAAPHDAALAQLLLGYRTGALARGEGLFAGVGVLGRGDLVSLQPGAFTRMQVREFDLTPHGTRAYGDLCDEFRFLFRQGVARSLDPLRLNAVTVSGGLDSSSIYCVAKDLEAEGAVPGGILGINFTAEDGTWADEREYTVAITQRYGPGIVRVPMQPDGFLDSLPALVKASEVPIAMPAGNLFHRQFQTAAEHGAATFLTGFWGDEAFSPFNHWYHLLWTLRVPSLLRVAWEHHRWIVESQMTARGTLASVVLGTIAEITPKRLRQLRRGVSKAVPAHPLASGRLGLWASAEAGPALAWRPSTRFAVWQRDMLDLPRVRYHLQAADAEVATFGMRAIHPFLDADLTQFLLKCNGEQLNPGGRYKGLLRDALRPEVPGMVLERRSKGDFTVAYGAGQARDLARWLADGQMMDALCKGDYMNEQAIAALQDEVFRLTAGRDTGHISWRALDCAGLAHWLDCLNNRGFSRATEQ
jgi:asparagine synthase (glutamine-hydrolysing)